MLSYRSNGKRSDGITMVPWKSRSLMVWDATCVDTCAPSHLAQFTMAAGAAASQAEDITKQLLVFRRRAMFDFIPVSVET